MWDNVLEVFREYMGAGMIMIWFLVSLVYLFFREKRKHIRILFLYVPLILLFLFFNPLFAKVIEKAVGDEIYYRFLWLLPVTIVIAYAAADIYNNLKGKKKAIFAVVAAIIIMISGKFIYSNQYFHKAENRYHVPQSVVEICDAIVIPGREVMAVFPEEFLQYVRQYTPLVCMPYGRDVLVKSWGIVNKLYNIMQSQEIDAGVLAAEAKEQMCHFIILPESKKVIGNLQDYDYFYYDTIRGYVIYKYISLEFS